VELTLIARRSEDRGGVGLGLGRRMRSCFKSHSAVCG